MADRRPKDYPQNARKWTAKAIEKVGASIRAYGFRQPVGVDRNEVIIIGHLRRAAARSIGLTEVPVYVAHDLTPEQVRGLLLMDNRSHEEADWDLELLGSELMELQGLDFDLSLTGSMAARSTISFPTQMTMIAPMSSPPCLSIRPASSETSGFSETIGSSVAIARNQMSLRSYWAK